MNKKKFEKLIEDILIQVGEKPGRQGLQKTPRRVAASLEHLTSGYRQNVREVINAAVFDEEYDEMVVM